MTDDRDAERDAEAIAHLRAACKEKGRVGDEWIVENATLLRAALQQIAGLTCSSSVRHIQGLPADEALILRARLERPSHAVSREPLTDRTGSAKSSRDTYLDRLRLKKLVLDAGRGVIKASPTLF